MKFFVDFNIIIIKCWIRGELINSDLDSGALDLSCGQIVKYGKVFTC